MEVDLLDNFDTIKILLSTLGFPLFDNIGKASTIAKDTLIYKGKEANAEGEYVDDGFVFLRIQKLIKILNPASNSTIRNLRDKLTSQSILLDKGNLY